MWNMGFAFWGAYVIDKFGRRPMMLSSLSGMLCALIGWTVASAIYTTHGTTAAGTAVIPLIFIFTASYSTVWNGILTGYTVEVMSYDIRSKLICTQNLLVQATITGFNYLNPVALENIGWKSVPWSPETHCIVPFVLTCSRYYIIICIIVVLEILMVYFTYPETKSITLEEISIVFDGEQAAQNTGFKGDDVDVSTTHVENKHDTTIHRHELL
jgi:MFS family permease